MAETPALRPLAVGEVLDAGIKVFLGHWKPLMICVVGIVLPIEILSALISSSIDPDTVGFSFDSSSSSDGSESGALFAVELLAALGILLATAACFKAVSDAWLGGTPAAGRSLRFALGRLPRLLWLVVVLVVALGLAFIALVVPFVWLSVAWSLAIPALLFERIGAFKALGRSFQLVQGRWWPILGALLCAYLLAIFVSVLVSLIPQEIAVRIAPDNDLVLTIASVAGGTVSQMLTTPYLAAVISLLYFDQRVRKEGFDLQLLAEGLERPRDADSPVPAPLGGTDVPAPARTPQREWWRDPVPTGSGTYGSGYEAPSSEPRAPAQRPRENPEPDRADWLPPEAPRGPGGL